MLLHRCYTNCHTINIIKSIKTKKINVRQKVDKRAGQLSLPHVTKN